MGIAFGVALVFTLFLVAGTYGFFLVGNEFLFGLFALASLAPATGLALGVLAGREGRKVEQSAGGSCL